MHLLPNYLIQSIYRTHECTEEAPFSPSLSSAFTLAGVRLHTLCLQDMSSLNPGCRAAGIPSAAALFHWRWGLCCSSGCPWRDYFIVLKLTLDVMLDYGRALRDRKKYSYLSHSKYLEGMRNSPVWSHNYRSSHKLHAESRLHRLPHENSF